MDDFAIELALSVCAIWRGARDVLPPHSTLIVSWTASIYGKDPLWIARDSRDASEVGTSTCIGLAQEADRLLGFYIRGNRFVSDPKVRNS